MRGIRLSPLNGVFLYGATTNFKVHNKLAHPRLQDGPMSLGFVGCRDTLPHLQRLAVYTGEALPELEDGIGGEHE